MEEIKKTSVLTAAAAAGMIDHTLLKSTAVRSDIAALCEQAKKHGFASVCVNPVWVCCAAGLLRGSSVHVCTVIGFPLGAAETAVKADEAALAVTHGADEADMVIDIASVLEGDYARTQADIQAVVDAARAAADEKGRQVIVKVILETCCLSDEQIVQACRCAQRAGADFVKTSTGFGSGGATAEHVALMRRTVGAAMGVKASGGIRNAADMIRMIEAGANRIGTSAGEVIIAGLE